MASDKGIFGVGIAGGGETAKLLIVMGPGVLRGTLIDGLRTEIKHGLL